MRASKSFSFFVGAALLLLLVFAYYTRTQKGHPEHKKGIKKFQAADSSVSTVATNVGYSTWLQTEGM